MISASVQSGHNKTSLWSRWQEYSCSCCNISSSWRHCISVSRNSWLHKSNEGFFHYSFCT